jgi:hypothetical protein
MWSFQTFEQLVHFVGVWLLFKARRAKMTEVNNFKKRQDDAKKKQSGELPPDLDQDGKMINPHNPDFITKVPWYLGDSGPTLKHHNVQKVDHFLSLSESDELIKRKVQTQIASKQKKQLFYRKGSCKNCGAMTHQEKDCVERPRSAANKAWKTGELPSLSLCPSPPLFHLLNMAQESILRLMKSFLI